MQNTISPSDLFEGIAVFVGVIKAGSFTSAAEKMGHSTSFISKTMTKLEKRLATRLLNRTTRTISLTDSGRAYYERCSQIVIDAENALRAINHLQESPRGILKVNAPVNFGSLYLLDLLPKFMSLYPEINLELEFNDRMIDVVAEGVDVVIRVGANKDSNLVARRFTQSRGVIVASPDYLAKHGIPIEAHELKQHNCIVYSIMPNPTIWDFEKNKIHTRVKVRSRVLCNSAEIELSMAVQGVGITRLPLFSCESEIKQGNLIELFSDYDHPQLDVYAVYPHRQYLTAKVRAFIDFLVANFEV